MDGGGGAISSSLLAAGITGGISFLKSTSSEPNNLQIVLYFKKKTENKNRKRKTLRYKQLELFRENLTGKV